MAQVIYSFEALADLERFQQFFGDDSDAAADALLRILAAIEALVENPEIGRPVRRARRELVISRGKTGYLALYEFDPVADVVRVLRLRHQREAGYS